MADKKNKAEHFLHIKRHTEGTSNEISVSVLDARKKAVDSEEGKERKTQSAAVFSGVFTPSLMFKGGKKAASQGSDREGSVFSSSADSVGSGAVSVDPEQEIARRKARRRTRRIISGVVGFAVIALLAAATVSFLAVEYQRQQSHQMLLNEALADLSQADKTIVAMDAAINAILDEENVVKMQEIQGDLPAAAALLDTAYDTAQLASEGMRDSAEKEAAGQALASIKARKIMIDEGFRMLAAMLNARRAAESVSAAWDILLAADATAREASALVANTTAQNVELSKEKTKLALSQFNDAKAQLSLAAEAYASADLHLLNEYTNKRIEAMNYALASDEAIVLQDKKTAEANNESYNQADAQAVAIAKQLPGDPTRLIYDAYDTNTSASFATYNEARRVAGAADSFLRDYLGTSVK
ncbi:MAG: hypothetical protein RR692_02535 [Raoultibacter sp.]